MAKPTSKKTEEQVEVKEEMQEASSPNVNISSAEKKEPITPNSLGDSIVQELSETVEIGNERIESEKEFLQRILFIQHTGGFGRHLDTMINERIKLLK